MTTVLDETRDGHIGVGFADAPYPVNVAVSRATERFVLVTNHDMLPRSRNLRDLIGYMAYHDLEHDVVQSRIVSVFDLLYKRYSERLDLLAGRLRNETRYPSENIARTVLCDLLDEPSYQGLRLRRQVLVQAMLRDLDLLDPAQLSYVQHRASVDFVVVNAVTRRPLLAIEVDGFRHHEGDPLQQSRDRLKDAICATYGLPLLRLPTTGSDEIARIRAELDRLLGEPSTARVRGLHPAAREGTTGPGSSSGGQE